MVVRVCRWVWMVVRFVCVIRVPVCARVSRVCPGSPRCLFTGKQLIIIVKNFTPRGSDLVLASSDRDVCVGRVGSRDGGRRSISGSP